MNAQKILVIEDKEILAVDIINSLKKLGYDVHTIANSVEPAIQKIADVQPQLVLIDICLAGEKDGVEIVDIIQNIFKISVLYITDFLDSKTLNKNKFQEPFSYIAKSFTERDLYNTVEMALYKDKIKKQLQRQNQRLLTVINSMGCAVVMTDINACIQMMNPVAEILTGWEQKAAFGKYLGDVLNLVDKDTGEEIVHIAMQAMKAGVVLQLPENCILVNRDGRKIPIGDTVSPIRDDMGVITGAVIVFQDITERKQKEAQLVRNAFYDGLTALPNRVLFLDRLKQASERCKRRLNYHFAVLFLDLDSFKIINDRFGHGMGDDLLVAIARRLESCLRSGDTVARFGGDEFAVLLEDIKDVSDAINIAKRIQETLSLPVHLNEHEIFTTASIGIALSCNGYEEPTNLLRDADIAMYRAKGKGENNYLVFEKNFTDL
ncbi:MAG: diguanylate cyclase [Pelatocladus maniniholoensis HA4357-MV3]|jgi:diguanylate cyclase (GGDEF)-like protein/PAS domain S-box-containing protein|uniref:Diguanylate cyclase n=1 Tax=Pelatocladus maniniholoensis HA4357-MV3 TaxID=1117104 RepID=A0A9E3LUP5_9NOST|nr:diguanylate cyclase [Pelatocladus maniniholoensis HA4357-MV3]BAZ68860.1 response regulator receiver modulated diguanylate cyclase with PAS/PAC sensor [Fischerella sp. NIES-4106]